MPEFPLEKKNCTNESLSHCPMPIPSVITLTQISGNNRKKKKKKIPARFTVWNVTKCITLTKPPKNTMSLTLLIQFCRYGMGKHEEVGKMVLVILKYKGKDNKVKNIAGSTRDRHMLYTQKHSADKSIKGAAKRNALIFKFSTMLTLTLKDNSLRLYFMAYLPNTLADAVFSVTENLPKLKI